jgi:predicted CopG family antitoxin
VLHLVIGFKQDALMPTTKKRINLTVDDDLYEELEKLKVLKGAPSLNAIILELTREALELQEDLYFAKISEEREEETDLSHDEVWKS